MAGISLGAGDPEQPGAEREERHGAECVCDCDWHALTIGPARQRVATGGRSLAVEAPALRVAPAPWPDRSRRSAPAGPFPLTAPMMLRGRSPPSPPSGGSPRR